MGGFEQFIPMIMSMMGGMGGGGGQGQQQSLMQPPPDILGRIMGGGPPAGALPGLDPSQLLKGMKSPFGMF